MPACPHRLLPLLHSTPIRPMANGQARAPLKLGDGKRTYYVRPWSAGMESRLLKVGGGLGGREVAAGRRPGGERLHALSRNRSATGWPQGEAAIGGCDQDQWSVKLQVVLHRILLAVSTRCPRSAVLHCIIIAPPRAASQRGTGPRWGQSVYRTPRHSPPARLSLSVFLTVCLSACLPACLPACLSVCLFMLMSLYARVCCSSSYVSQPV